MAIAPHLIGYLRYVHNTGGNATIAGFDEDWEPIGPRLREELMPTYIHETKDGKLDLTEAGMVEVMR